MDSTEFYRQEEMKAHLKCDELSAENESLHQQLAGMTKERDEIAAQANMLYRMVDEMDDQLAAALAACEAHDEAMIDRCAEVCEEYQGSAETCAAAIRELKGTL